MVRSGEHFSEKMTLNGNLTDTESPVLGAGCLEKMEEQAEIKSKVLEKV